MADAMAGVVSQNKPLMVAMLIKTNEMTQRFSIFIIIPIFKGVKIIKYYFIQTQLYKKMGDYLKKLYLFCFYPTQFIV
ncbi:hypothetical protein [Flavobacterium piscinae]|uniref:hypothetical protein n=1 Tax=Flavobacterium piscinae TaxID=2506424 RepID=UPI002AAAB6CA|nr:hypothetical protein [Flavobacterium piscinae]